MNIRIAKSGIGMSRSIKLTEVLPDENKKNRRISYQNNRTGVFLINNKTGVCLVKTTEPEYFLSR